jgi:hypothetical protein
VSVSLWDHIRAYVESIRWDVRSLEVNRHWVCPPERRGLLGLLKACTACSGAWAILSWLVQAGSKNRLNGVHLRKSMFEFWTE